MSLFKWSSPERRDVDSRMLPIIPNEIYFEIFGHVAPSTGNLTREQTRALSRLSGVCRLFANFCLPRIFEHVEFSGSASSNALYGDSTQYRTSRGSTLCAQIAAKQPLALALAQKVKVCRFVDWALNDDTSWVVQLFSTKYIAGMVHMKHMRQLEFSNSFVDPEHWAAVATLEALENLSFDRCRFLRGPADDEPDKRIRLKVSWLQVTKCRGYEQPFAAVDIHHLRTLVVDFLALDGIDWFPQSALTEIRIYPGRLCLVNGCYINHVHDFLVEAPKSLEDLWLPLHIGTLSARGIIRSIFDDLERKPPLRSLTLKLSDTPDLFASLASILDDVCLVTGLQTLRITLEIPRKISLADIQRILRENNAATSSLRDIDIDGKALRLADGVWSEVTCNGG